MSSNDIVSKASSALKDFLQTGDFAHHPAFNGKPDFFQGILEKSFFSKYGLSNIIDEIWVIKTPNEPQNLGTISTNWAPTVFSTETITKIIRDKDKKLTNWRPYLRPFLLYEKWLLIVSSNGELCIDNSLETYCIETEFDKIFIFDNWFDQFEAITITHSKRVKRKIWLRHLFLKIFYKVFLVQRSYLKRTS
jgi:hypothetical protein